jgi:cysteinyl-tRNA synthetase
MADDGNGNVRGGCGAVVEDREMNTIKVSVKSILGDDFSTSLINNINALVDKIEALEEENRKLKIKARLWRDSSQRNAGKYFKERTERMSVQFDLNTARNQKIMQQREIVNVLRENASYDPELSLADNVRGVIIDLEDGPTTRAPR